MAKFPSISVEIEYLAVPSSLHVAGSDLFFCLARRADTGRNITQPEVIYNEILCELQHN